MPFESEEIVISRSYCNSDSRFLHVSSITWPRILSHQLCMKSWSEAANIGIPKTRSLLSITLHSIKVSRIYGKNEEIFLFELQTSAKFYANFGLFEMLNYSVFQNWQMKSCIIECSVQLYVFNLILFLSFWKTFWFQKWLNLSKKFPLATQFPNMQMGFWCQWKKSLNSFRILKFLLCRFHNFFWNCLHLFYFSSNPRSENLFTAETAKKIIRCPTFKNLKSFWLDVTSEVFDFQIFAQAMKVREF